MKNTITKNVVNVVVLVALMVFVFVCSRIMSQSLSHLIVNDDAVSTVNRLTLLVGLVWALFFTNTVAVLNEKDSENEVGLIQIVLTFLFFAVMVFSISLVLRGVPLIFMSFMDNSLEFEGFKGDFHGMRKTLILYTGSAAFSANICFNAIAKILNAKIAVSKKPSILFLSN